MGIFDVFKNKFSKLNREELIDSIIQLENEEKKLENKILSYKNKINEYMEKGKNESDKDLKIFYAKKINSLKEERNNDIKSNLLLSYNIQILNKLKISLDNESLLTGISGNKINNLLKNQKALNDYLYQSLSKKKKFENNLVNANDTFKEMEDLFNDEEENEIYDATNSDDELLAMFETSSSIDDEIEINDELKNVVTNN